MIEDYLFASFDKALFQLSHVQSIVVEVIDRSAFQAAKLQEVARQAGLRGG